MHRPGMPECPDNKSPGHRALRRHRHSQPQQIYLITTVTRGRLPAFDEWATACAVSRAITDPGLWRGAKLLCWVLMPDHLHVLVQLGDAEPLAKLIKRVKSVLARIVHEVRGGHGRLWAAAYHDRALRQEEDLLAVARYIVANPVRAGLVRSVGNYPFWDAIWLPR